MLSSVSVTDIEDIQFNGWADACGRSVFEGEERCAGCLGTHLPKAERVLVEDEIEEGGSFWIE